MKNAQAINAEILKCLQARHWKLQRLCSLQRAFARDIDVTPVFMARALRVGADHYTINGYLGLVDQQFERAWLAGRKNEPDAADDKLKNRFCLMLHIANIDSLRSTSHFRDPGSMDDVVAFCDQVSALMERMPHDTASLARVFDESTLLNIPLEKFVLYGQDEKFAKFRQHVENRNVR